MSPQVGLLRALVGDGDAPEMCDEGGVVVMMVTMTHLRSSPRGSMKSCMGWVYSCTMEVPT